MFRNEMIEAASGSNPAALSKIEVRAKTDPGLALEFRLLSLFQFTGLKALDQAPNALLTKARALPRVTGARKLEQLSSAIKELIGAVSFDSWVLPAPVGVRGSASLAERRLRLEAEGITLDLRAEKNPLGWDFVGRLSGSLSENEEFVALLGSKKVERGSDDFYQWSSSSPPRRVILQSHATRIVFQDLSWKKPKRK